MLGYQFYLFVQFSYWILGLFRQCGILLFFIFITYVYIIFRSEDLLYEIPYRQLNMMPHMRKLQWTVSLFFLWL
jgi:hypothetical protein